MGYPQTGGIFVVDRSGEISQYHINNVQCLEYWGRWYEGGGLKDYSLHSVCCIFLQSLSSCPRFLEVYIFLCEYYVKIYMWAIMV